jgi:hypothetical protein
MKEKLDKGNFHNTIKSNLSKNETMTRKEIRSTIKGLMAMNNKGPESFTNHATADEERFMKYYSTKRVKQKDKHTLKENDDGLRKKVEQFKDGAIELVKEDLMRESFSDAIYSFHTTLQKIMKGSDQDRIIDAEKAGRKEVKNIMDNLAVKPIKYINMTGLQKKNIHRSFSFLFLLLFGGLLAV